MWIDIIGYTGMAIIISSFFMRKAHMIRFINIFGASLSLLYGFLTRTWPTAILNGALLIVNTVYFISYLIKRRQEKCQK